MLKRDERVWVCGACEREPAAFLCKADAASLCTKRDAEIHLANPLARRHQRVSIPSISGWPYGPSATNNQGGQKLASAGETEDEDEAIAEEDEDEAASLLNPGKNSSNQNNGFLSGGEVDEYLDLEEYNSSTVENQFTDQYITRCNTYGVQNKSYGGDNIVPVQSGYARDHLQQQQHQSFQYSLDYDSSKSAYSYNGSLSHSVSLSSVDVGIVPESTMSDISISQTRPPKGAIDLFCAAAIANLIQMPMPYPPPTFSNGQGGQGPKVQREEEDKKV